MKIFIGGMKLHHQRAFALEFPEVEFEFAAYDDPDRKWRARAVSCDIVIVDQSRCTHRVVKALRKDLNDTRIHFTDSKAHMREIIKEAITNGKVGYRYT